MSQSQTALLVIAHRGNSSLAPENTLAAYEAAAIAGVDMIEIDIHLNAEGEVVVIHDDSVDRTTDGSGLISDLNTVEVARLDAGSWFSPHYAGQQVPMFADVIDLALRFPEVHWLVEFKGTWSSDGVARVGAQLAEAELTDSMLLQSFDVQTMEALAKVLPQYRRGLLVGIVEDSTFELAKSLGVMCVNPALRYVAVVPERVKELQNAGFDVMAWTANEYADWDVLVDAGVNGIITDRPDRLIGYLAR